MNDILNSARISMFQSLKLLIKRITPPVLWKWLRKAVFPTKVVWRNIRAAITWRGQSPRVYFHWEWQLAISPIWSSYLTQPPLRYAPYLIAEICHWISGSYPLPLPVGKRHIVEAEHMLVFAEQFHRGEDRGWRPLGDWYLLFDDAERLDELVGRPELRRIITFSHGLVEHFKFHIDPRHWPKLGFIHPSFPPQAVQERAHDQPFTILVIASRYSDKGVPEALKAFKALREGYGERVRMILVSQAVPPSVTIPDGVIHHNVPLMSPELKAEVYRSSDVLLLPNYGETVACFPEAYAFGVPVITTRIHHDDEFVEHGVSGFLLETPIYAFSEKFGRHWKRAEDFLQELDEMRRAGALDIVVDQIVSCVETLLRDPERLRPMRDEARRFYREHFTIERRNNKLRDIYNDVLDA